MLLLFYSNEIRSNNPRLLTSKLQVVAREASIRHRRIKISCRNHILATSAVDCTNITAAWSVISMSSVVSRIGTSVVSARKASNRKPTSSDTIRRFTVVVGNGVGNVKTDCKCSTIYFGRFEDAAPDTIIAFGLQKHKITKRKKICYNDCAHSCIVAVW